MPSYIFAWLVHIRGCSCPNCTNKTNKRTSQTNKHTSCLVGALETSAPPERLLNKHLLHLAVSRANDVQTLLEFRKFNTINSEECCCALSYGCSVDAGF